LYLNHVTIGSDPTLLQEHFGMTIRSLFVCAALILFAGFVYGAGSYHRTRDGQTLVWRDVPSRGDEATWSGERDKDGYATGSGVLTWYKVRPAIVTGSNILDTRRYVNMINHYSGRMVRGKFQGAVTYLEAEGRRLRATSGNETNRPSRRQKATRSRTAQVRATPKAEPTPTPFSEPITVDTPELTSARATPTPAPEESSSPSAEEPQTAEPPETDTLVAKQMATPPEPALEQSPSPSEPETAVPPQTDTLVAKQMATPPSEQQARQSHARSLTVPTPPASDDPLRSLSAQPSELPKPPRGIDAQTVAQLDAVYQAAVKANDVAILDEILADDFVLITDRGASLTKADLIKEAKEKRTIYEHHDVEESTQKVRIWRDTAVVTALLRTKGTRDQNPFDYKVWLSETYVRTPTGWRYVFGQALKPDAK
jgi:ketosteroid isomerase-like protein